MFKHLSMSVERVIAIEAAMAAWSQAEAPNAANH
jgi:hypothetical protein